jgi:hypothetical protein
MAPGIGIGIGVPFVKHSVSWNSYWTTLTFDDIANLDLIDPTDVVEWNTLIDLPTNGTPFTSVEVSGNAVKLIGGSGITLKNGFLGSNGTYLRSLVDSGCIIEVADYCFDGSKGPYHNLNELVLPALVTLGDWGLYYTLVSSFIIADTVTSIGNNGFFGNTIVSLIVPASVTSIGEGAFSSNNYLESLVVLAEITAIPANFCSGCAALETFSIADTYTSIGDGAFRGCSSLHEITICDLVTTIGRYAFEECNALTSLIIPDSVQTIGEQAIHCDLLTTLVIGSGVTSFYTVGGLGSVIGCDALEDVFMYPLAAPACQQSDFYLSSGMTLHVRTGATGYQGAPWGDGSKFTQKLSDI